MYDQSQFSQMQRILLAAQRVLYDPKTSRSFLAGLQGPQSWPQKLAIQAAGLLKLLDQKSNGTLPRALFAPAVVAIVLEMAQFVQEGGGATLTGGDVEEATKFALALVLQEYGVTDAIAKAKQGAQPQGQPVPPQAPPQAAAPGGLMGGM